MNNILQTAKWLKRPYSTVHSWVEEFNIKFPLSSNDKRLLLNRNKSSKRKTNKDRKRDGIKHDNAIPMLLWCPECKCRHIDEGKFATKLHHTHACQNCGHVWRPAIVNTVGVKYLPGFKNA